MNNLTPEQLSFRAGYEQGRFDAQVESAQQQEPVAWLYEFYADRGYPGLAFEPQRSADNTPLYTSPTANTNADKPWVGLTDEEIEDIEITWEATQEWACFRYAARAIEAKLKDKNK